ncbi:hypothetical protein PgNI_06104, partial [Pyricularia grisea]|uniref:Uncharacterized protein n=1 Tax=Pyricularia grisea TaxID=148305 RepID=A0A6P8B6D5_PYRGI
SHPLYLPSLFTQSSSVTRIESCIIFWSITCTTPRILSVISRTACLSSNQHKSFRNLGVFSLE